MSGYLKGFVSEADAASRLPTLKAELSGLEGELAVLGQNVHALTIEPAVVTG